MRLYGMPLLACFSIPIPSALAQSPLTPVNESGQIVVTIERNNFSPAEIHVRVAASLAEPGPRVAL